MRKSEFCSGFLCFNVPALGEVENFGTDYFLLKIKFLAENKRDFALFSQFLVTAN